MRGRRRDEEQARAWRRMDQICSATIWLGLLVVMGGVLLWAWWTGG